MHGRQARISWARLLKRVFHIDLQHCPNCGGELKIIAADSRIGCDRADPHAFGPAGPGVAASTGTRADAARGLNSAHRPRASGPTGACQGADCGQDSLRLIRAVR